MRRRWFFGAVKAYVGGVLIGIDQLANTLVPGGFPDETLSSRMGRRIKRRGKDLVSGAVCSVLDKLDKDHCQVSIEENPDGSTDAHHLGRVIHELPPEQQEPRLVKVPPDRLTKLRNAGFVILAGLLLMGCPIQIIVKPQPSPAPSPSPTPAPVPDPFPSATPEPAPSPSPSPVPSPSPGVPPADDACVPGSDGNYPIPPAGTCPACWRQDPNLIAWWGIDLRSKVPCSGPNCPYGVKVNVDITPHSIKPYVRHRAGGGSDTWIPCQPEETSPEVPEIWVYPPNAEPGLCDPFSGSRFWCHHKPQQGQGGPTKFEVRPKGKPWRSTVVNVP